MQESKKTIGFVATAAVLGLAAFGNAWINQPGNSADVADIGKPFYEEFTSTEAARSLEVSAIDPETGALKRFGVQSDGDLWRIPTHFDYPAEAAARIAQTSASVMGIDRQALVGRGESEFEKFGVVDPLKEDIEDPETAGKRITLNDENGDPLVDYIIGNEVEDSVDARDPTDFEAGQAKSDFYVRRADETKTFRVSLDVDLSTRFSDWIDPDLLRINSPDVTEVSINNYKIEERGAGAFGMTQLYKAQGDQVAVERPSPADPWTIEGLDAAKEEVETTRMNEVLSVLDEMKIVGVRPKFKYEGKQLLTAELTPADIPELKADAEKANYAYQALQEDLMEKGFNFGGTQEQLELVSENGELEFGTSKGLRYRLHVGKAVADEEDTIEIGSEEKEPKEEEASDPDADSTEDDSNRFMYVRVTFDESLLGDRPEEPKLPEVPTKPEGYEPAKAAEKVDGSEEEPAADAEGEAAKPAAEDPAAEEPAAEERNPAFVAYDEALKAFETAKGEHEMNLTRHKQDNEAFDKKIEDGKKLVEELNQRFGDWYYVIAASNINTLQSTRDDLVKLIVEPPDESVPGTPPTPDISFPEINGEGSTFKNGPEDDPKPEAEMKDEPESKDDAKAEQPAVEEKAEAPAAEAEMPAEEKSDPVEPAETDKPAETAKPVESEKPESDVPAAEETPVVDEKPTEENPTTEEKPDDAGASDDGQE